MKKPPPYEGGSFEDRLDATPGESPKNQSSASGPQICGEVVGAEKAPRLKPSNQKRPRPGTQADIVLAALEREPGRWVGVHELMNSARSAAVHSVVSSLRLRYGIEVENRQERGKRQTKSFYRIRFCIPSIETGQPKGEGKI